VQPGSHIGIVGNRMQTEGPQLEQLLHRLAECPPEFLELSEGHSPPGADVIAIVCDLARSMSGDSCPERENAALTKIRNGSEPQRKLISVICWLLHDEWFRRQSELVPALWKLLTSEELERLAALVRPDRFIHDPDRREELVRISLAAFGWRPQGESLAMAADRLTQLDSAERDRVLRSTAAAERRAREIREAMARKQALESASRYGE
ncbi:MAG TPA: hypothetical protein VL096_18040, partial [Pirellulaceae bacterium]|nr:hypothetical protein [Pirellulaceae bacterium]